ncbi:MAG: hypothetical protein L6V84_07580 [Oscillospiraceae bacterium]|nr:MAG: hypothetical protein L6V84_07580 [Oscillospiraceae bacterium]
MWVDPVTGEVLREGGMHGGTAEPGGQSRRGSFRCRGGNACRDATGRGSHGD